MVASCPDVPSHCKAGVVKRHGKNFVLEVEKVPVPQPGTGQLLLKLTVTGICYSDVHYMLEDLPLPRMGDYGVKSPGHEGAGMVVAIGDGVTGWKIGDRAGVKPTWDTCMCCELCLSSLECHCAQAIPTGLKVPGTYQEYILSPAKYTTRIPVGVDDFCAGPIMCSGSTIYRSMVESGLRPGQWAAFIGAGGGVGHMGVQLAKAMGARVIGIDSGQEKKELCLELGCEAFIDFTASKDIAGDAVQISDGEGAHAVFVTASSPAAYTLATKIARVGGKIMCVGMPPSGSAFAGDDPMFLILRNLKVIGTLTGSLRDTKEVLEFAARGLLRPVYETYSISQLPDAVAKLRAGQVRGRCVVDFNAVQAS